MKRYNILFTIAIVIFCFGGQLNAGNPQNNPNDDNPDSSKQFSINVKDIRIGKNVKIKTSNSKKMDNRKPDRIEQKTFSNINDIELDHKYGNVVIKESDSKNVMLEIQYFDGKHEQASCEIITKNKILVINTINAGKNDMKINYIINLPKNIGLSVLLKYGNMKADKISGTFDARLAYSNLDINTISSKNSTVTLRYGKMNIGETQDMAILLAYSNLTIDKAKTIDLSGNYNKIVINKIDNITMDKSSSYNSYQIEEITDFKASMKYDKIKINNLKSSLDISCAYTDINVKITSPKVKDVKIKGSYSDIIINLDSNMSAFFDSQVKYGDLIVSKMHKVKYTEQINKSNYSQKKGQIGDKTPNTNIIVSNTYSDIKIR